MEGATDMANIIQKIKDFYNINNIKEYFLHLLPDVQPDNIHHLLTQAGLVKNRGWMKFTRDTSPAPEGKTDLSIKKIDSSHAKTFSEIVTPCFDMPEESAPLVASIINHPNWHFYMSFDGDKPAGTGAMFVKDNIAYFDWGSTHQDFRQRGGQGALLRYRINDAINMNCTMMVTATGEEVPGDPQHSYKNIMRVGFKETYLRENWSLPGTS